MSAHAATIAHRDPGPAANGAPPPLQALFAPVTHLSSGDHNEDNSPENRHTRGSVISVGLTEQPPGGVAGSPEISAARTWLVSRSTAGTVPTRGDALSPTFATTDHQLGAQPPGFCVGRAWALAGSAGRRSATATVAVLIVVAVVAVTQAPFGVATVLCVVALVPAALVDVVEHRLPNAFVVASVVPVLVAIVVSLLGSGDAAAGALAGAVLVGGPLLVVHLISPAGMGFGDVKAGTVVGAGVGLLGATAAVLALVVALFAGAAWALAGHRRSVPLGPGLVVGAVLATAGVVGWGG